MKMPDNLRRVAIVTGAARGIGAATACRLARDGMAVAALDLEADACGATVDAISFLASEDAGYVSGQVIYVTGGPLC
jgi:NAD(P)-dependent dehydrogenase (short-subunit alcohol dehydrogenase family)